MFWLIMPSQRLLFADSPASTEDSRPTRSDETSWVKIWLESHKFINGNVSPTNTPLDGLSLDSSSPRKLLDIGEIAISYIVSVIT